MTSDSHADQFQRDGYVVLRSLLSPVEVADYKTALQAASGRTDADFSTERRYGHAFAEVDGVTARESFWPLIFHETLVSEVRRLVGPTARYAQHSDLHVHLGAVGWHRDGGYARFGVGPDWDERAEPYRLVRVAIYLQSHAESGFSFGVFPGSHRRESPLTRLELRAWNAISFRLLGREALPPLVTVRPTWIPIDAGDALVFDARLVHSGSAIYGPKYGMFLQYGADNQHSRDIARGPNSDPGHYREMAPALVARLKAAGLYLEGLSLPEDEIARKVGVSGAPVAGQPDV